MNGNSAVKALNIYAAGTSPNLIFAVNNDAIIGLPLSGYTPESSCLGYKFQVNAQVIIFLLAWMHGWIWFLYLVHQDIGTLLFVFSMNTTPAQTVFYGSVSITNNNRDAVAYQVAWNHIPASQAASGPILCIITVAASSDVLYYLNVYHTGYTTAKDRAISSSTKKYYKLKAPWITYKIVRRICIKVEKSEQGNGSTQNKSA